MRPSRRAQTALVAFFSGVLAALVLSAKPALPWRAALVAVIIALAWKPVRTLLLGRGPGAVRRITWSREGLWEISDGAGRIHPVTLGAGSATLGPLLLLVWISPEKGRFHALVDSASTDPMAFRALKCRLNC